MDLSGPYWMALAILACGIVNMALGGLWYSPLLFGKPWMALIGLTDEKLKHLKAKGMAKAYVLNFLAALVLALVLEFLFKLIGVSRLAEGLQVSFWLWLGFIATVNLGGVLWEGKPLKLYWINMSYWLASLLVMGTILTFLG